MLTHLSSITIYHLMLLFSRVGAALMLMPAIGEAYVLLRSRLVIALLISYVFLPITSLPPLPKYAGEMLIALSTEVMVGLLLGIFSRLLISILHVAGMIIATQSGLSAATLFDPTQGTQGAIIGNFLTLLAVLLMLSLNLHATLLLAISRSYELFPVGAWPSIGDAANMFANIVASGFSVAVHFAIAQLVFSVVFYMGAGVLARLMPAVQIFFIIAPLQILLSFGLMLIILSSVMLWYMDYVADSIQKWPFF